MIRDKNLVVVTGVLERNDNLRYPNQKAVCDFVVACDPFGKGPETDPPIPVTAWGELAEEVAGLKPGSVVAILGLVRTRERTAKTGGTFTVVQIVADRVIAHELARDAVPVAERDGEIPF